MERRGSAVIDGTRRESEERRKRANGREIGNMSELVVEFSRGTVCLELRYISSAFERFKLLPNQERGRGGRQHNVIAITTLNTVKTTVPGHVCLFAC